MSNRSDLDLATLYPYLFEHSVRESRLLHELRNETAKDEMARMQIAPEQGQLMGMLLKMLNAKRVIEIGTFTGYSSLCMAMALPEDGRIICCDISKQWTDLAQEFWRRAGVIHKISLRLAPALDTLQQLLKDGHEESLDAAFIDADKENYEAYFEACMTLIRPGGLIMIDNVLWGGRVIDEKAQDADTLAIRRLNNKLFRDERVDISMLPVADGLTLALKRH